VQNKFSKTKSVKKKKLKYKLQKNKKMNKKNGIRGQVYRIKKKNIFPQKQCIKKKKKKLKKH
jgi:hypothetical protein